ncbi:MAG TPA: nitroreductase family deazaflavin-dependent oxidoreductase [Solirubrobacteraceae bacterium]|nr:nitroreductase family deazaflavin-dependent oxidoreductase [Solirubrobacteraceae bacterium]
MTRRSGIPPFYPETGGGAGTRSVQFALKTRSVRRVATPVAKRVDPVLRGLTRGRLGMHLALPFVSMTTNGAKSGQPRTTAVLYFNDGEDLILIASNYGGAHHPAWYHNLKANPTTLLARGDRSGTYTATEVTDEPEREHLFGLAAQVYRGFADYREMTDQIGRRIPIMRLRETD